MAPEKGLHFKIIIYDFFLNIIHGSIYISRPSSAKCYSICTINCIWICWEKSLTKAEKRKNSEIIFNKNTRVKNFIRFCWIIFHFSSLFRSVPSFGCWKRFYKRELVYKCVCFYLCWRMYVMTVWKLKWTSKRIGNGIH